MTATKTKPSKPSAKKSKGTARPKQQQTTACVITLSDSTQDLIAKMGEIVADAQTLQDAAEEIMLTVKSDKELTPGQLAILKLAYVRDDTLTGIERDLHGDRNPNRRFREERRRASRAAKAIEGAGTAEEFAAAKERLDALEKEHAAAVQAIDDSRNVDERQELRGNARELAQQLTAARKQVSDMERAREELDKLVPRFAIEAAKEQQPKDELQKLQDKIGDLQNRIRAAERLRSYDLNNELSGTGLRGAVRYAKNYLPEDHPAYPRWNELFGKYAINRQAWQDHIEDLEFDRPLLEQDLQKLKQQVAAIKAKANAPLEYHCRKYGL